MYDAVQLIADVVKQGGDEFWIVGAEHHYCLVDVVFIRDKLMLTH